MLPRRSALLLPLAALACGPKDPEIAAPSGPISFRHLLPLRLNLAEVVVAETDPALPPGDLGRELALPPAAAVRQMARERLFAMGNAGQAVFGVSQASLGREGGNLVCALACRLEVTGAEAAGRGFVEASARASMTLSSGASPGLRQRAGEVLLRQALGRLNVEFEFQARRNLRAWLVEGAAAPAPAPGGVQREELPRG